MYIAELLTESFPYPPGSDMPDLIIDLRDPVKQRGHYSSYIRDHDQKRQRYWSKTPRTHIVLTKDGGLLVYFYGDENTIPWRDVLSQAQQAMDTSLQTEIGDIVVKGTGYLIARSREFASWSGDRNRYSTDLITVIRALYERGAATLNMPIWLGNTAGATGEHIGSVRDIIGQTDEPRQLTLFHGTDNMRLRQIMATGLQAMAFDQRVWNHTGLDKVRPAHREEAVYLTASRPQAEYYAKKAVDIDRKRFGGTKRREIERMAADAQRRVDQMTWALNHYAGLTPEQIAAEDEHARKYRYDATPIAVQQSVYPEYILKAQRVVDQSKQFMANGFYGKFEPVILQVTLYRNQFAKLMADDDYLAKHPEADPKDWRQSLSEFGQVAFAGQIDPARIKVVAQGNAAGRKSQ